MFLENDSKGGGFGAYEIFCYLARIGISHTTMAKFVAEIFFQRNFSVVYKSLTSMAVEKKLYKMYSNCKGGRNLSVCNVFSVETHTCFQTSF